MPCGTGYCGRRCMSKSKKQGQVVDPAKALAELETPKMKWSAMAQIAGGFAVLWLVGFMVTPYVGNWGLGIVGVLTLVATGFGIYVWRLTRRSKAVVDIMKGAASPEGRERALAELAEAGSGDALKALAHAQLLGQTDPNAALEVLEAIDIGKAPAMVQDDVRSQLAMLYLRNNRPKEARDVVDNMRLDKQPNAKSKALYAAVMAESFARTGSASEARKLLETYDANDPEFRDILPMLLRAQAFTYLAQKKRGLAKTAVDRMAQIDPNLLGAFLQKGTPPELMKLARQAASGVGLAPKMKLQRR